MKKKLEMKILMAGIFAIYLLPYIGPLIGNTV